MAAAGHQFGTGKRIDGSAFPGQNALFHPFIDRLDRRQLY